MKDTGASVIAKLKQKAQKEGIQLQLFLNLFCQEEFLRRLQKSKYKENLILKGGFLLYSLSQFESRPTMDADYLLSNQSNSIVAIEEMVKEILCSPTNNHFIKLEIRDTELIAENKEYAGVRVNLVGFINKTRTPFCVDLGVGDIVFPSPINRVLPILLPGFENPEVLTYSLESIIAEKFDAIASRMELSGRMKDFFDIYYLASTIDFDGSKLQEAINKTFLNRGTSHQVDILQRIHNLSNDTDISTRWKMFCKKTLRLQIDFVIVLDLILKFLKVPYEAILNDSVCHVYWNSEVKEFKAQSNSCRGTGNHFAI